MKKHLKSALKAMFHRIGFDIIRVKNSPEITLCGLRSLPIHTVIDVGANTGQFARQISRIFPQTKMYCFEPLPEPFKGLERWALEQDGRVKVFNVALGESEGTVEMFFHTKHSPSSSLLASTDINKKYYPFIKSQKSVRVKLTTLDNALSNFTRLMKPEILVKLDVQGYEDRVLRGGSKTLSIATACILEVCIDDLYHDQAKYSGLVLLLDQMGFRYSGNLEQVYAPDGHVIFFNAMFIKRDIASEFRYEI
jgi:FkbM family methyltransferase